MSELLASVRVHSDVVSQTLGEEVVLLNLKTGVYWGLNRSGAVIWSELAKHGDVQKTLGVLRDRYEASEEQLSSALEMLLAQLLKEGLLIPDDSSTAAKTHTRA